MWLFCYFNFERNNVLVNSKSACIFLNKNINFNENETESKNGNPHCEMCFSSYKNCKLKMKLWWVEAHERKKQAFFVLFILSEGNFCYICVLSQCIVYWIHFQNIYTSTSQKTLLHALFCLFLRLLKAFSVSLRSIPLTINPEPSLFFCSESNNRQVSCLPRTKQPDNFLSSVFESNEHGWSFPVFVGLR